MAIKIDLWSFLNISINTIVQVIKNLRFFITHNQFLLNKTKFCLITVNRENIALIEGFINFYLGYLICVLCILEL
jgi:hypothetical protein